MNKNNIQRLLFNLKYFDDKSTIAMCPFPWVYSHSITSMAIVVVIIYLIVVIVVLVAAIFLSEEAVCLEHRAFQVEDATLQGLL